MVYTQVGRESIPGYIPWWVGEAYRYIPPCIWLSGGYTTLYMPLRWVYLRVVYLMVYTGWCTSGCIQGVPQGVYRVVYTQGGI